MKYKHEERADTARKYPNTDLNDHDPNEGPTHKAESSYEASSGQPSHHTDTGNKTEGQSMRGKLSYLLPSKVHFSNGI